MGQIVTFPGPAVVHEVLPGSPESGTVVQPTFSVRILDDEWTEISHLTLETRSYNATGTFQAHAIFSEAGKTSRSGKVTPGSKLDKLLQIQVNAKGVPARTPVEIVMGYANNPLFAPRTVFNGFIDIVSCDRREDTVTISGRDKSAVFWETSLYGQLRNQTIASTVRDIAVKHGFDFFIVDQGTPIGAIYDFDSIATQMLTTQGMNEWTFLTQCADIDGHAVYMSVVNGVDTLNYVPIERFENVATFTWGENIDELLLTKYYGLNSSRVGVEILSTNQKRKENVLATAGAARSGGGDALIYRRVLNANVDPETAGIIAELLALFQTQLEFVAEVHTVGAPVQSVRNKFRLANATPAFDRDYRIIRVNWQFGMDQGWRAELTGIAAPQPDAVRIRQKRRHLVLGTTH